ncbi:tRNA (5-methylaminomethyl-2-thiouridine)(34)-methyltransferase MnmD [Ketogulonicigenium vulgare]|nr:tRNA (5-methylaminomethyl-2-thiouridine)(34)-methyltransferase MnmD [Ketogulonicigenium vulgare]ADO41531.1 tRNA 5-methylaminomethyl-2-thiouridine biosynthesis bifunctional protein [Ketogulonicigenium vulgare Y25]ALJ80003.1 FAD-dependent oxidoreductase [Ketogulonicigenium vulgare]ANW32890.1 FAD-dependent oxidoreductase [Ketogulonicigenium vulgare]AOZ53465.1 FAD dependent oxidoreductase domain protein [Ketogulonicigenium vulgare]
MDNQHATITWRDGTIPVSDRFDDPYFSLDNGLEETRYVFLRGNDLPARFTGDFHIAELGFGTGLNFLVTLQEWRASGATGRLTFTTFEAFPMTPTDRAQALAAFPAVADEAAELATALSTGNSVTLAGNVQLNVIIGDARETLPAWQDRADAWYLDGFSPAKNPEMWDAALLAQVARHMTPAGTLATYAAAGFVRANLEAAGLMVTRIKGYGRKRHMTTARFPL